MIKVGDKFQIFTETETYEAFKLLNRKKIPVIVRDIPEDKAMLLGVKALLGRPDILPADKENIIYKLKNSGKGESNADLSKKLEIIKKKIRTISGYKHNSPELNLDRTDYELYYSYSIWKYKTYLDRVMFYKKYFDEKDEGTLIHFYDCLLQDLCQGKEIFKILLANNYIGNLESIYNVISKFKRYNKDTISDQLRRERILDNLKFLKNLSNRIIFFNSCRIVK